MRSATVIRGTTFLTSTSSQRPRTIQTTINILLTIGELSMVTMRALTILIIITTAGLIIAPAIGIS